MQMKTWNSKTYGIKLMLWQKFIVVTNCIKKEERFYINNLTFHLKKLKKIRAN